MERKEEDDEEKVKKEKEEEKKKRLAKGTSRCLSSRDSEDRQRREKGRPLLTNGLMEKEQERGIHHWDPFE